MSANITLSGIVAGDNIALSGEGYVTLGNTCLGGNLHIFGNWVLTDESGGVVTIVDDSNVSRAEQVSETWDKNNASHVTAGTTGWHQLNAVMNTDARLDNLDAPISAIPTNPFLANDQRIDHTRGKART